MSRKRKRKKSELKARAANIQQLRAKEQHVFMKLGAKLRAYFFTGILVTAPVSITFYMAYKIILWIDAGVGRLLPPQLKSYYDDLIGMFAAGFVGSFFVRLGDWMVKKMPVISSVYSLLKQVFETFLSNKSQAFSRVALLEYPRKGIWILGFVSTDTGGEVRRILDREMVNVFIPTTPNPTSGFLIFVPREDLVFLEMTVEEGLKFVISGGIVTPEEAKKIKKR